MKRLEASTVDWEIFTLKIIGVKNFCGVKFFGVHLIHKICLTVDGYNMSAWSIHF